MSKMERRRKGRKVGKYYGVLGLTLALLFALAMHRVVSEIGHADVEKRAQSEANLVVELTSGFVRTYSNYQARHARGVLPGPATFRADALKHVEESDGNNLVTTGVVGLPGREIAQEAKDDAMREQLLELDTTRSTNAVSSVYASHGQTIHRSLWAFYAKEQACADCHNQIQNLTGANQWQIGDLMGAQVVEQNIDPELSIVRRVALFQSALLFVAVIAAWFCCFYLINHFRLVRELKILATTDPLTGCINRRELYERIDKLTGPTDGALLMLDLDKFKDINDKFGHVAGDKVICDFTGRLRNALRDEDWVARFGGEEFVAWLPNVEAADAITIAERLRKDVEKAQVVHDSSTVQYTVSIGLHIVQAETPHRFDAWIKAADKLVYRAKKEGRNRIVYETVTV